MGVFSREKGQSFTYGFGLPPCLFHHDLFPLRKSWFLSIGIRSRFEIRLEVLFVLSFLIYYENRVICVGLKRLIFENARDNGCSCYMNMHMFIDVNTQIGCFIL